MSEIEPGDVNEDVLDGDLDIVDMLMDIDEGDILAELLQDGTDQPIQPAEFKEPEILGERQYYILSAQHSLPLALAAGKINAWVSEYENGHHPVYQGFHKHRILPEQWDWLLKHPKCPIVAWMGMECPAFPTLACLTHSCLIRPITHQEGKEVSSDASVELSTATIHSMLEAIQAEERDV